MLDISIVTYNSVKWIDRFLESLVAQSYPLNNISVFVTDNGSTDGTVEKLLNKLSQFHFRNIEVSVQENLGFGAGHNNNFKKCTSDFILVTNIDLEYENNAIQDVLKYARLDHDNVASWEFRQKPFEHPKNYNPTTLETSWSSSACVLFRRSALESVSGYEPRIFMYGEDVDLSWRLRARGFILKYFPKSVCWHYTYEDNKFKKTQFLGSVLSNLYIRARFGTNQQIEEGEDAYRKLYDEPEQYEGQRIDLINQYSIYQSNFSYFRYSGYQNKIICRFYGIWDYEKIRDGAFYEYQKHTNCYSKISVLVRTYIGRDNYLKMAIKSVLNQTYTNFEIIVVEDGGDHLRDTVENFCDDRIFYYPHYQKVGRCVTGNIALEKATGEYCVFLDDDDYFYCDHLEVLISALYDHKDIQVAYANAFEIPTHLVSSSPFLLHEDKNYSVNIRLPFSRIKLWETNYMPIQCVLFARTLYLKLGGFDLELQNLEDWNLWTRFSCMSDFLYVDKTTSIYRTPLLQELREQRHLALHNYYEKAVSKQETMFLYLPVIALKKELMNYQNRIVQLETNTSILDSLHIQHTIVRVYYLLFFVSKFLTKKQSYVRLLKAMSIKNFKRFFVALKSNGVKILITKLLVKLKTAYAEK
jgi:GT2 family glycosyltransferase